MDFAAVGFAGSGWPGGVRSVVTGREVGVWVGGLCWPDGSTWKGRTRPSQKRVEYGRQARQGGEIGSGGKSPWISLPGA
jgi:hypothetical protein